MLKDQCLTRERVTIDGPAGALCGELVYPAADPACAVAVIANPHPLMGGTMDNNVVVSLSESLPREGCATLRFDYRGVGNSEGVRADIESAMAQFWQTGTAPQDAALIDDVGAAVRWARRNVAIPLVLVGYSFGAYAAACTASAAEAARVIFIAPTLCQHEFPDVGSPRRPLLVIHGDNDFATPREATQSWIANRAFPPRSVCLRGADHFFRGREPSVCEACAAFIASPLPGRATA